MLSRAEVVGFRAHHHAIERFRSFAAIGLVIEDGIGADPFDLSLEGPVNVGIIGRNLDDGRLFGPYEGDVLRADSAFDEESVVEGRYP